MVCELSMAIADFSTRNLYRSAVEDLARGSRLPEPEVAELACRIGTPALDGAGGQEGAGMGGAGRDGADPGETTDRDRRCAGREGPVA